MLCASPQAPGMLLTHYAPDLPAFLLATTAPAPAAPAGAALASAVVVDFGARAAHLAPRALAYRDLSAAADGAEAARELFATLRWAEEQAEAGALCVLLPELGGGGEAEPALADRLYRAASGRRLCVDPAGALCEA